MAAQGPFRRRICSLHSHKRGLSHCEALKSRLCREGFSAATDKNVSVTRPTDDHELPLQKTQRDLAPTGRWLLGWFKRARQRRPSPDEQGNHMLRNTSEVTPGDHGVPGVTKNA